MKRYLVELEAEEREALEAITRKGSHRSRRVVNALVLLNCDEGEFNERRATGREIAEHYLEHYYDLDLGRAGGAEAVP